MRNTDLFFEMSNVFLRSRQLFDGTAKLRSFSLCFLLGFTQLTLCSDKRNPDSNDIHDKAFPTCILIHHQAPILEKLLTFLVLKPSFSQSFSVHSHLFLAQVQLIKYDHSVFGSHWQQ